MMYRNADGRKIGLRALEEIIQQTGYNYSNRFFPTFASDTHLDNLLSILASSALVGTFPNIPPPTQLCWNTCVIIEEVAMKYRVSSSGRLMEVISTAISSPAMLMVKSGVFSDFNDEFTWNVQRCHSRSEVELGPGS